jgi:KDO2-lipid IV(A) lauroyltransferase
MNFLIYWCGRAAIAFIQLLPLNVVARLGRWGGTLAYHLDAKHRRIVYANLNGAFDREKSAAEIEAIARETFKRIGENYICAVKTAAMSFAALRSHVEFTGLENFPQSRPGENPCNAVVGIGHFGNFEMYARLGEAIPYANTAATYRGLKQPALDRLLQHVRGQDKCRFFERRADGPALRALLDRGGLILGLLADQSSKGLRAPFLGRDCNTGLAPAILALRYDAVLSTGICYRVGLAKWRIEFGKPIPTRINGEARTSTDLMLEVNRELEAGVRRDPANWFWVHRRWKD